MPFNADPYISKTPGFPKEGITFYDISPIFEDSAVIRQAMDALADLTRPMQPDIIAGVDARGFLFALPLALELACGMVMVRKAGKLRGKRVVLCDDLLATDGRLEASARLVEQCGGILAGAVCVIELTGLKGRARLDCPAAALQTYEF